MSQFQQLRRRVRIAQILLLAILVAGTVYVGDSVVGGGLFSSPKVVTVHLPEAGGLHPRAPVTYRGQKVGVVTRISLTDDGVAARIELNDDVKVPRDSVFEVRNLSAVGEQHLYIAPNTDQGPWLTDGSEVRADDDAIPLPMPQVLADVQSLMKRIDVDDIATISGEIDAVFGDGAVDLRATSIELERAFELLRALQPDLEQLTRDALTPLTTVTEQAQLLRRTVRNARLISAELARVDPIVRSLLTSGPQAAAAGRELWTALEPDVVKLIDGSTPLLAMAGLRVEGLQHWLDWLPQQLAAMAGSTRDGSGRVLLVPKLLKNCDYGVDRRSPAETSPRPPRLDARCSAQSPQLQGRGAQNVPRP
ncbi:MlaD family protein [Nocardioides sp. Bht2]|uniref:MlaD family protein n=1 Tax=Nocardioides sp. Bht2 TaxID=3392297 RepID=UPI0039B3B2F2